MLAHAKVRVVYATKIIACLSKFDEFFFFMSSECIFKFSKFSKYQYACTIPREKKNSTIGTNKQQRFRTRHPIPHTNFLMSQHVPMARCGKSCVREINTVVNNAVNILKNKPLVAFSEIC